MSFIEGLLPWISGLSGLIGIYKALQPPPSPPPPPPMPPTLSWEEAMKRATETLTPIYDEQLQKTLEDVDKELIRRGFFGQLPGAVLSGERATDVERAKAAAIAALAGQMQGQSEQNALAQQQLAAQWALNNMQLMNQQRQNTISSLQGLGNSLFNIWAGIGELTGFIPTLQGSQPTAKTKENLLIEYLNNLLRRGGNPQELNSVSESSSLKLPSLETRLDAYINPWASR